MKKQSSKKLIWLSLVSVVVLAFFIGIAGGSSSDGDNPTGIKIKRQTTTPLGGGVFETQTDIGGGTVDIRRGTRDPAARWHGPTTFEKGDYNMGGGVNIQSTEKVNMRDGLREGKSITTFTDGKPDKVVCYKRGGAIPCQKSAQVSYTNNSAYERLMEKYPWFVFSLYTFGFEDAFIKAYVDTLETIMFGMEYTSEEDFHDDFSYAIDSLYNTVYDTIVGAHSLITILRALEEIKNCEFRLAVLDHYRQEGSSTFNIVKEKYPGYLQYMNMAEIIDQDFELFCNDMDSLMNSYGPLDLEDPFFTDSVDARIYYALMLIGSTEPDTTETIEILKSALSSKKSNIKELIMQKVHSVVNGKGMNSSPSDISMVVAYTFFEYFDRADKIKLVIKQSFYETKSVISIPMVTTDFLGNDLATTANLSGYIHEDGGAAVTSSGIAWAAYYSPTISDNIKASDATTGSFMVTLDGLTEGDTYYARAYATNSTGIAYGNCVEFTASSSSGIEANEIGIDFRIYPNPASAITTFRFRIESSENMVLTIVNMRGQEVYQNELGTFPQGENRIELDLSDLKSGTYHCQLSAHGKVKATGKLVLLH